MSKYIIEGGYPLKGKVTVSGNKNEALPSLMACLLTDETVVLKRIPKIKDVMTVCAILKDLGVEISWQGEDCLYLNARNVSSYTPDAALCTMIRASILFLGPLLARFGKVELPLPGGDVIGARRVDSHFEGIESLGGRLNFGNPIKGEIKKIIGGPIYLDEPSVTATENIILLAVLCEGITELYNAASEPHVVGLCNLLCAMGAKISGIGTNRLVIIGVTSLHGCEHTIGPDFMEVGSFLCLGAVSPGEIEIEHVKPEDLRFVLKTLSKLGIEPNYTHIPPNTPDGEHSLPNLHIKGSRSLRMKTDISGRISSIYSGPWPAFPSDLMSVAIVAATQVSGTMIFHEKMYEGRMFFTDKLMAMGANIVLCDPHRVVITGPAPLSASRMSSPDVRAGMAMMMAAVLANGKSEIENIYQIERGYLNIDKKLEGLGVKIQVK